jgi:hypothetical protein
VTAFQHLAINTTPTAVRIVVWGATDLDRRRAISDARSHHRLIDRRIAHIEHASSPARATDDPDALVHCVIDYDCTWAAYRLETARREAP